MARDPDPVLVATGLAKRALRRDVLSGVDLALARGEFALLSGANGSGKTTLLRVLATLDAPDSGALTVAGVDAREDGARARRAIGHAGHEPGLYAALTARENLRFFASFRGPASDAEDALAAFSLENVADERAGALSRGTRQRVALARAFLGKPALVLLDEPWTGLDDAGSGALARAIEDASARGAAVLAASHEADRRPAKRRLALARGRVTEAGA